MNNFTFDNLDVMESIRYILTKTGKVKWTDYRVKSTNAILITIPVGQREYSQNKLLNSQR
jgi:hypothetical protein